MKRLLTTAALGACALALDPSNVQAQSLVALHPFSQTGDIFIPEPGADRVYRLQDIYLDGRYDGPGETVVFYDDTIGPVPLTNPNGITVGLNGVVYVSDSSEEIVLRLLDIDGDGTCHGPGEATIFFDGRPGGNASGVLSASPANLTVDLFGVVWLSVAGDGANNQDRILRLSDNNFDGDANDLAEASAYYDFPPGALGTNVPQDVTIGPDGRLYVVDIPSTGTIAKGVYRLNDANSSGSIDATEIAPFFIPPALASNPFFWGMTVDANGFFYLADTTNETIWKFRDENGDNVIDNATEAVQWWVAPGSTLIWRLAAASDGSILAAESQAPDSVLRFFDTNSDGVIDPLTEVEVVWSDLVSAIDIVNPRSIATDRQPTIVADPLASISAPFSIGTFATEGDTVLLFWSAFATAPVPVLGLGFAELDLTPGLFGLLSVATAPFFGPTFTSFPAINQPGLVGVSIQLQALAGKVARLRLSNRATLTFVN